AAVHALGWLLGGGRVLEQGAQARAQGSGAVVGAYVVCPGLGGAHDEILFGAPTAVQGGCGDPGTSGHGGRGQTTVAVQLEFGESGVHQRAVRLTSRGRPLGDAFADDSGRWSVVMGEILYRPSLGNEKLSFSIVAWSTPMPRVNN